LSTTVRTTFAIILLGLLSLSIVSGVVTWWAGDSLYEPDIMISAFGDLPDDPQRAEELGGWIAEEAVNGLAVEERIEEALPFGLSLLAEPVTDRLEGAVSVATSELVQTELFADIWDAALPAAHEAFVQALDESNDGVLSAEAGVVSVNVSRAIIATYDAVADVLPEIAGDGLLARVTGLEPGDIKGALGNLLVSNLPDDLGTFVLIESQALASIQEWSAQLGQLFWLSVVAAVTAGIGAVVISRTRTTLVAVGVTVAGALLVGLLAISGIERAIINALADIPFSTGGLAFDSWLDGWRLFLIVSIVTALGVGVTGAVMERREGATTEASSRVPDGR
jgi:hypothetical protein